VLNAIQKPAAAVADDFLIAQEWSAYSPDEHAIWAELVKRRIPEVRRHACREYLEGFEYIGMREETGWNATPVSGFMPPDAFFEMLATRRFPTTTWLRDRESLEYTPEPDIFHDVFGHVPMHAHPVFADFLQQYGKVCAGLRDKESLERMGRLFWFTVEFGVIRQDGGIKLYGSGLISSHGEAKSVIEQVENPTPDGPEIREFDLDQVLDQQFLVSEMQKVLYAVESFEQIYEAAHDAERRL
jgi:phenylalanine-4-hydroxylase